MRCPYCGSLDTQVKDSRPTEDSSSIRRRRVCPDCGGRFTTFERVQLRELVVVKTSRPARALRPRQDSCARSKSRCASARSSPSASSAWSTASCASSKARAKPKSPVERIGELVMQGLRALDDVAYVRFASVYRNFREARDFGAIIDELAGEPSGDGRRANRRAAPTHERAHERRRPDAAMPTPFMAAALAIGRRGLGETAPQSGGRRAGRARRRRSSGAAGPSAAAARTPRPWRCASRRGGARRDALRDARAVQPSWPHAALRRGDRRGRHRARRLARWRIPIRASAGRGHALLREAGIEVRVGVGAERRRGARNLGHILRVTRSRPMVTLKLAETRGRLRRRRASTIRASRSPAAPANGRVHMMRAMHDAIMVGIGTARGDDPLMTVRLPGLEDRKPRARRARHAFRAAACVAPRRRRRARRRCSSIGGRGRGRRPAEGARCAGHRDDRASPSRMTGHVDVARGAATCWRCAAIRACSARAGRRSRRR